MEKDYCNVVKRSHLSGIKYDAWKYCCDDICNGEQFCCPKRPTQISFYATHHDRKIHGNFVLLSNKHIMLVYAFFVTMMSRTRMVSVYYYYIMYLLLHFCIIKYSILISFLILLLINRPFIIKFFHFVTDLGLYVHIISIIYIVMFVLQYNLNILYHQWHILKNLQSGTLYHWYQ